MTIQMSIFTEVIKINGMDSPLPNDEVRSLMNLFFEYSQQKAVTRPTIGHDWLYRPRKISHTHTHTYMCAIIYSTGELTLTKVFQFTIRYLIIMIPSTSTWPNARVIGGCQNLLFKHFKNAYLTQINKI